MLVKFGRRVLMVFLFIVNEVIIIIIVFFVFVFFGGFCIVGVGKGVGCVICEFKEEIVGLNKGKDVKVEKDIEVIEVDVVKDEIKLIE